MNKEIYIDEDTILQLRTPKYVTSIKFAEEFIVNVSRKFNWFQKKMMKFFFGWDVKDID